MLVFWSRDPDVSQHGSQDSLGELKPGINGPTAQAGVRDADTIARDLLAALKRLGLDKTTDVFVTADHGFTTITKASVTSPAAHFTGNDDVALRSLPSGFLAVDVAAGLELAAHRSQCRLQAGGLRERSHAAARLRLYRPRSRASRGHRRAQWRLGPDLSARPNAKKRAHEIVTFLMKQDYVSGLFVNDRFGRIRRHAADERDRPDRLGQDAQARDLRQFPLLLDRLRRSA